MLLCNEADRVLQYKLTQKRADFREVFITKKLLNLKGNKQMSITLSHAIGATPHCSDSWHYINWANCINEVQRLQFRIVKAIQSGKQGRAKALQWILTHSFSAKALAVKRITNNRGKATPGV